MTTSQFACWALQCILQAEMEILVFCWVIVQTVFHSFFSVLTLSMPFKVIIVIKFLFGGHRYILGAFQGHFDPSHQFELKYV